MVGSGYEKDLEVIASSDHGLGKQCKETIDKANRLLGLIFSGITSRSPEVKTLITLL